MDQTDAFRKITVQVPAILLEHAQEHTKSGITQTITAGLEKLAASAAYRKFSKLEGRYDLDLDLDMLREDRGFE